MIKEKRSLKKVNTKIVLIALYRFQNFPIRIMHSVLKGIYGITSETIFFKNGESALKNPPTEQEEKIFTDIITKLNPDLAKCLRDNKPYDNIPNLWIKNGNKNKMRPLIQDLDSLPFASAKSKYYFIESDKVTHNDTMLTDSRFYIRSSRGCPCACSFCVNSILRGTYKGLGSYIRRRSVDNIIKEIKENNRVGYIAFFDEAFGIDEAWLDEFKVKYKKEIGLPFFAECNPREMNTKMLESFVEAGIEEINFGLQTGNDYIRNNIFYRSGKNRELIEIAYKINNYGIKIIYDFILDNPYDDKNSLKDAIELLLGLPRPFNDFFIHSLQYFPNYSLTKKAIKDKHIKPEDADDTENTIRNWAYFPRLLPYNKKQILQNIIWLIARNHAEDTRVRRAVFSNSFIYLHYLNLKACILGKLLRIIERIIWRHKWIAYLFNGYRYILKGNFKTVFLKVKKYLRNG